MYKMQRQMGCVEHNSYMMEEMPCFWLQVRWKWIIGATCWRIALVPALQWFRRQLGGSSSVDLRKAPSPPTPLARDACVAPAMLPTIYVYCTWYLFALDVCCACPANTESVSIQGNLKQHPVNIYPGLHVYFGRKCGNSEALTGRLSIEQVVPSTHWRRQAGLEQLGKMRPW